MADGADTGLVTTTKAKRAARVVGAALGLVVTVALVVWAFAALDVVVATAVAIVLVTTLGMAVAASGRESLRSIRRSPSSGRG